MADSQWPEMVATASADEVRAQLAAGADPNAVAQSEQEKSSAVLVAARAGNLEAMDVLVEAGADINAQSRIRLNPFLWGCISGNLDVVKRMVEAGTDLELTTRFGGVGIHPAAEKGHVEVTQYLAENTDVNVNHTNILGWTPLLEAVMLGDGGPGQQRIVRYLLEAGAGPLMVDQYGVTPRQHAEKLGYLEIAQILEGFGG